ncbi:MAG: hypothetical protein DSY33_04735 [Archaeoglobus sp.]|nr:MAG: hypothetical protein DSY33_04735 [Archaeoglobus sp.]
MIHLAKAGLLHLIRIYDDVVIPKEVKHEIVDIGKANGYSDAFLVEKAIKNGWIKVIEVKVNEEFARITRMAGLHDAEIGVIYYAYQNRVTALLDEDSARVFARSLGVDVKGSLGLLIEGLREGLITREGGLKGLDKLADVMYLSASVYKLVLKEIEKW